MSFTNPYPAIRLSVDTANSLANGLVGFWPLTDGGSSTTAKDITSNANDGTQSGGVSWASTAIGTAASFDGSNDYFDLGDNYDFGDGTTDSAFSISGWIYLDTLPAANKSHVVLSKTSESSSTTSVSSYLLGVNSSGELGFRLYDESGGNQIRALSAASSFSTGQWYHLAGTYTGSGSPTGLQVYINGVNAVNSQSVAGTYVAMHNSTETAKIGCTFLNNATYEDFNDGYISNVRIYNRALSATEVATLYHRPWEGTNYGDLWPYSPPAPADATLSTDTAATSLMSGCQAWWLLTDGSGTTATDIVGSNNGTLVDLTWGNTEVGANVEFPSVSDDNITTPLSVTGYTDITVSGWFRNDGSASGNAYGKFVTTSHTTSLDSYMKKDSNNLVAFRVGADQVTWSGTMPAIGTWFHFVGTWSASGTVNVWVDGQKTTGSGTSLTSIPAGSHDVYIGDTSAAPRPFDGGGQNVRVWNRVLTDDEIILLYERPFEGIEYGDAFHYDPPTPANLTPLTSDSINNSQIGWWACTDGSGSSLIDISSGSNDGTASGSATFATTSLGVAAEYDGSASFHWLADSFSYTTDLTVSCWMRSDGTGVEQPAFCKGRSNDCHWWLGFNSSDQVRFATKRGSLVRIDVDVNDISEWHHVVAVQQGTSPGSILYIDGVEVGTNNTTTIIGSSATAGRIPMIGAGTTSTTTPPSGVEDFQGNVANVRIWSRALTADEVWSIYANPWLGSAYTATAAEVLYNYIFRSKRFRRLS